METGALSTIGFALMASDNFVWDADDLLGDIIADCSCPEINYGLDAENIRRFRAWLTEQETYPAKPATAAGNSKLISVRRKGKLTLSELLRN